MEETNILLDLSKFYLCIDKQDFKEKASSNEIKEISMRIANYAKQVTINELESMIVEQGRTICGTVFKKIDGERKRQESYFAMQNIFGIDVDGKTDNEGNNIKDLEYGVLFQEVQQIIDKYGISVQFAYKTFSDGIKGERFRLIFQTDVPIYDIVLARAFILALQYIFENYTDKSCKDPNRMFLGGKSNIQTDSENFNQTIPLDKLFQILYTVYKERYIETHNDISQFSRDFRNYLASEYGINTINNCPAIRKIHLTDEQIKQMQEKRIDEGGILLNQHFNIDSDTHDEIFGKNMSIEGSSLYYIYYRTGREIDNNLHEFYEICMLKEKLRKTSKRKDDKLSFCKNENIKENVDRKIVKEADMLENCQLIKELHDVKRHIHHDEFFGMSTNFLYMKIEYSNQESKKCEQIGAHYFIDMVENYCKTYPEEYKKRWDKSIEYNEKVNYLPSYCSSFCPYYETCHPTTNIINTVCHTTDRIIPLNETKHYAQIEEVRKQLYEIEKETIKAFIKEPNSSKIQLVKCQTGIGKTYQMIQNIKELLQYQKQKFIVAVPRNDLKKEIAKDFKDNGVEVFITPDIEELENKDLQKELNQLRATGLYNILREKIDEELQKGQLSFNDNFILDNYVTSTKQLKEYDGVIVTTHKRLLMFQKEILENAIVIIDEDIIDTLIEGSDITMGDVILFQEEIEKHDKLQRIAKELENKKKKITSQNYKQYQEVEKIDYSDEERKLIETIMYRSNIKCNIFQFLDSDFLYCYNPIDNDNNDIYIGTKIKGMKKNILPLNNILILSATINEKFYKELYPNRQVTLTQLDKVKYYGKVYQYGNYSFSNNCITEHPELTQKLLNNTNEYNIITFKELLKRYNLNGNNFFATSGLNKLQGNNIRIFGLPNRNQIYYMGLAYSIYKKEYKDNPTMSFHIVEINGYKVKFYTYDDETLRNIHLWSALAELEQCVGRARLVNEENKDRVVLVFAGLPVEQSIVINDIDELYRIAKENIIDMCLVICFNM